jgi:hypothetical protein
VQKTAAPQGLFDKFPKQTIREIFSGKQGKTKRITGFSANLQAPFLTRLLAVLAKGERLSKCDLAGGRGAA